MNISNLHFFDKFGKNLNLSFDSTDNKWVGTIYFPEVSIYLFDNENIFILEKIASDYKFPSIGPGEELHFEWEDNKNSDEYFIYDVEKDLDLGNFFINKKESDKLLYSDLVPSSGGNNLDISLPLQLNIAFNPSSEKIFKRKLLIKSKDPLGQVDIIAEIDFYGEGLDEDERFGVWAKNFGIKFNKEDANILKDYDIKEAYPDWDQLNIARKSLIVNRDQIYPYIGTYKGLSNFVNILGYKDVLQVKEYWKNINKKSSYFKKQFLVDISDYLDDGKIDEMNILDKNKNIKVGKQFRKTEFLALVYQFTKATDVYDDDGIPEVEETTTFTVNEMFYKLNKLGDKLRNEFLPLNVKIKDIIGEFIYFQKITIKFWKDDTHIYDYSLNEQTEVQSFPGINTDFIVRSLNPLLRKEHKDGPIFGKVILNSGVSNPYDSDQHYPPADIPTMNSYIEEFYEETRNQKYPDIGNRLEWEDGDCPERVIGAPAIFNIYNDKFTFRSFRGVTFDDLDALVATLDPYYTLQNLDFRNFDEITWIITKDAPNPYEFKYRGKIKDLHKLPHILPYSGTYRVIAHLHDFYGNTNVFSKIIRVDPDQKPHIIATTRLEDKFKYSIDNLDNVRMIDFGTSPFYYPKINVLDNEKAITEVNVYKNLLEWQWFFKNRYGMGQNIYDAELYDVDSNTYIPYNDPTQSHPKKEYWGIGGTRHPMKLEDFKDVSLKSMFFNRFTRNVYVDDFKAGFYISDPKPGQTIKMSLFSTYTIPNFNTLDELIVILNDSDHPAINLFNYEIIDGRHSDCQYIVHAQAEYLSKEMYHIIYSDGGGSPSSPASSPSIPTSSPGSPLTSSPGGSCNIDKYTFFLPKEVYSRRLIEYLKLTYPMFDEETLFLHAKTSDILSGSVQDPNFWVGKKCWKFENDKQIGYLPTTIDQNSFNINDIKVFETSFDIPENCPMFFTINNIDGKNKFTWTLYNTQTEEEVVKVKSVPFFVWKFKDLGRYALKVEIYDNKNNIYTNEAPKMINVLTKQQYIKKIESRLDNRKLKLIN